MKRTTLFKLAKYGFFGLVCLITLLVLLVAEENFRGKRAWENYKRDAVARGQKLDLSEFIPPAVPDEQNFAMTPLLKPLFEKEHQLKKRLALPEKPGKKMPSLGNRLDGRQFNLAEWSSYLGDPDVLHALKQFGPEMEEISVASQRPYSRFPIQYQDGFKMGVPHITPLISMSKLFVLRSSANLALGRPSEAFEDCETLLRLADSVKNEPLLISALVRMSILAITENVVWQGISAHQWSAEQLTAFQSQFQGIDQLKDGRHALQGERAAWPIFVDQIMRDRGMLRPAMSAVGIDTEHDNRGAAMLLSQFPRGWFYQGLVVACCQWEQEVFPAIDPTAHRVYPQKIPTANPDFLLPKELVAQPFSFLKELSSPSLAIIAKFAFVQTAVDEAAIACALERYRLVHHEYPENLDALVPEYFRKLPRDVMNGEPLHYSRTGDGQFILYSVGWNGTDDHGAVATNKHEKAGGDWVWR